MSVERQATAGEATAGEATAGEATAAVPDRGLRVLIVEDEVLIALELEDLLADAGHVPVGIAASSAEAVRLGLDLKPDVVLLDINLADGPTGVEVARSLVALDETTVVFMTASGKRIPPDFAGAHGAIGKPYSERSVTSALCYFADRRGGRLGPAAPPPDGVTLSPRLLAMSQPRISSAPARPRVPVGG